MATTKEFHDYVMDSLKCFDVSTRKMMGEYCFYYKGRLVGGIFDGVLLLKITDGTEKILPDAEKVYPYEGSKTLMAVIADFENTELMGNLLETLYIELPEKPKKKKTKA